MVDVPVVAAAGLEGDVVNAHRALGVGHEGSEEALTREVLGEGRVRLPLAEDVLGIEDGLVGGCGHEGSSQVGVDVEARMASEMAGTARTVPVSLGRPRR